MLEPTWTFDSKLRKLDTKITEATQGLDVKFDRAVTTVNSAVELIKSDVQKELYQHTKELKNLTEQIQSKVKVDIQEGLDSYTSSINSFRKDISDVYNDVNAVRNEISDVKLDVYDIRNAINYKIDCYQQEQNKREIVLHDTVESIASRLDTLHFDIIDNEDNVTITYTNPNGKLEYGAIRKFTPDEETITSIDKKIALKYKFDINSFSIRNSIVNPTSLQLRTGKYLTAEKIQNDLSNATYNISDLSQKISKIIDKLQTVSGYVTSNNFKKATPSEQQLYDFAISCLSSNNKSMTKEQVPSATKIKNTFDNHIWILNRVTINGLTTSKWEDFGSDTLCVASNDGVHGLVTGSQDRYRGYIDLQGKISINGLEEDLTDIQESIQNINTELTRIQTEFSAKLNDIEERVKKLEA